MKRPDLSGLTKEQLAYVTELEGKISGSNELINELNLMSREYAIELEQIRKKVPSRNSILDDQKSFDRVMVLLDKVPKIKALCEPENKPKSKKEPEVEDQSKEVIVKKLKNIQDFALNKDAKN